MRRIFETVGVEEDRRGTPARLYWRQRKFVVSRTLDQWRYCSKWWLSPKGEVRVYYQLEARVSLPRGQFSEPRIIEVFQQDGKWTLSYMSD